MRKRTASGKNRDRKTKLTTSEAPSPTMSFIIRRQLSTLIPPKVASAKNIGSNPNAKRMADVVSFYKKLPTGPAPAAKKPTTPWGKYKAAYFDGDNASGKPLIHLAVVIILAGYTWEYQSHLKHHKH
ncbi:putative ATP synthase subunit [Clavispora lusitaniae]|nr:ATP synthase subunit f, mitochondrial domain protein [Clavispora lusitaniae]QFZ27652.1 putative ATP synthase subunit [Clavispora lusitaniae]QFZ33041.1 putative ATP synthase subunit [Clavispora lusitaniae]QFZ38711.1 putative ATP synthase subunit [Clavispora lusitaniae]QFZ44393.1 putative ATP synthase subunit [Clavispora lusitaniae]